MNEKEILAAIAYALHEETGKHLHDQESYVITLKHKPSAWSLKTEMMRALPR